MSGTRKMEKFELDAYAKPLDDERAQSKEALLESQAAAAIAELQPNILDALEALNLLAPPDVVPAAPEAPVTPVAAPAPTDAPVPQADDAATKGSGEEKVEALRTQLTRKFVSLADSVTEAFRDFSIGVGAYAIELTAPQGMSTGGGKQALQHLRLRPRRPGYAVIVAGAVNPVERRAELRDHDHLAAMNEVRFGRRVDISAQEWEQFLRKAEVVLNEAGIQSLRTPPPHDLLAQRRKVQRISRGAIVALVVVLLLASIVVWRVILALRAGR
jgi:hypothetical protein